jgi:hypothetical protein
LFLVLLCLATIASSASILAKLLSISGWNLVFMNQAAAAQAPSTALMVIASAITPYTSTIEKI